MGLGWFWFVLGLCVAKESFLCCFEVLFIDEVGLAYSYARNLKRLFKIFYLKLFLYYGHGQGTRPRQLSLIINILRKWVTSQKEGNIHNRVQYF